MQNTWLVVGLGNIGKQYSCNRHNVGFMFLDWFVSKNNINNFSYSKKFDADIAEDLLEDKKLIFFKPATYMNMSGVAVYKVVNFYHIPIPNIIVVHDDIDIQFGKIKISSMSSDGGHNGIKSINNFIANKYNRIRVGVDRPNNKFDVSNYVLSDFDLTQHEALENIFELVKLKMYEILSLKN